MNQALSKEYDRIIDRMRKNGELDTRWYEFGVGKDYFDGADKLAAPSSIRLAD